MGNSFNAKIPAKIGWVTVKEKYRRSYGILLQMFPLQIGLNVLLAELEGDYSGDLEQAKNNQEYASLLTHKSAIAFKRVNQRQCDYVYNVS